MSIINLQLFDFAQLPPNPCFAIYGKRAVGKTTLMADLLRKSGRNAGAVVRYSNINDALFTAALPNVHLYSNIGVAVDDVTTSDHQPCVLCIDNCEYFCDESADNRKMIYHVLQERETRQLFTIVTLTHLGLNTRMVYEFDYICIMKDANIRLKDLKTVYDTWVKSSITFDELVAIMGQLKQYECLVIAAARECKLFWYCATP